MEKKKIKVLNLYAGIGGNRKLWKDVDVTAVEIDEKIADIYQKKFPNDKIIICDAHEYLLHRYEDFDFIWSSPPCQSHSTVNFFLNPQGIVRYPDMRLYEEIIFLRTFFKGKWVIENVKSYYEPLIKPQQVGRHYFWSNFMITKIKQPKNSIGKMHGKRQKGHSRPQIENNAVDSKLGLHILQCAFKKKQKQVGDFCTEPKKVLN